ncbi:MLP-like protein 423 [Linum perenne]
MIAATSVYPRAMSNLYKQIRGVYSDGYTAGSIRVITFGPVVKTATEKIEDVDQENLTIHSTFTDDGGLVPMLFNNLKMKITVVQSSCQLKVPNCTVKWEFTYTGGSRSDITNFKNTMKDAYKQLDIYLKNKNIK